MRTNRNILFTPLGWGLGHASRIIPIIQLLHSQNHTIYVAGNTQSLSLITKECPYVIAIRLRTFSVRFAKGDKQLFPLLTIAIKIPLYNFYERIWLRKAIKRLRIDLVISDNRYGMRSSRVKCVIITHQLKPKIPSPFQFTEPFVSKLIYRWLSHFDEVWIPDNIDKNRLSGELTENKTLSNIRYIGPLSRFYNLPDITPCNDYELVCIVSGPEPHRTILADEAERLIRRINTNGIIIEGKPEINYSYRQTGKIVRVSHVPGMHLAELVAGCKYLIVRGGYSTIMDLWALGYSGAIVPTPGQTEQEYLGKYLDERGYFRCIAQSELSSATPGMLTKRKHTTNETAKKLLRETVFDLLKTAKPQ